MAFDESKDEVISSTVVNENDKGETLAVELCRYDGGAAKIQIARMHNGKHRRVGRLTAEEAGAVGRGLLDAAATLHKALEAA